MTVTDVTDTGLTALVELMDMVYRGGSPDRPGRRPLHGCGPTEPDLADSGVQPAEDPHFYDYGYPLQGEPDTGRHGERKG